MFNSHLKCKEISKESKKRLLKDIIIFIFKINYKLIIYS